MIKNLFLAVTILISVNINAQYIILDKDGYTNVRRKPNAKAEIVETVKKYQVFYNVKDILCYDPKYQDSDNWLAITTNMVDMAGYIYKKNIYPIENLPSLVKKLQLGGEKVRTINDSLGLGIEIIISFQPYNEKNKLEGKRMYGTDGWTPRNEIKEIRINRNGNIATLPENKFKNFYDVGYMSVWAGFDNEIYILLSGGDGSGGYSVMLSVLDGDIIYSLPIEC